jgi:phospholipase C
MVTNEGQPNPIRHVIQLILENRSFDQMLGCTKAIYPELEGIDSNKPARNSDSRGVEFVQAPMEVRQMLQWDPHHEVGHVAVQLNDHNGGFVKDFSVAYADSTDSARSFVMGYYPLGFLPALHTLAHNFTICDHWFSSLPGPTWPNRFFALSGTSNGRVGMPDDGTHTADLPGYFQQTQDTLFDRLNEAAIHWKVYFHDIPQTTALAHQREPHNVARYFYIDQFFDDARGSEEEFPQYCLIEPDYMGFGQNDAHPPHDIMRSEKLIADVYNAIRANDALWKSTLLIVMYDEHGGFYDHVEPPLAIPPDDAMPSEYSFSRFGVRVPAILVSPWIDARVEHTQFDHTSVLKYLTDKWRLGPLGRRTAAATGIGRAIQRSTPRLDTIERIELSAEQLSPPDPRAEDEAFGIPNAHQSALHRLGDYLKMDAFEKVPRIASVLARVAEAARAVAQSALERALQEPPGFKVSLAEPDKLALPRDVSTKDSVATFIMRAKRYAAAGLRNRLNDESLPPEQQQHSLQTLSLISGRNFHLEDPEQKVANAKTWLDKQQSTAALKPTAR